MTSKLFYYILLLSMLLKLFTSVVSVIQKYYVVMCYCKQLTNPNFSDATLYPENINSMSVYTMGNESANSETGLSFLPTFPGNPVVKIFTSNPYTYQLFITSSFPPPDISKYNILYLDINHFSVPSIMEKIKLIQSILYSLIA